MLGIYDYTVITTYAGVCSSVIGILLAFQGNIRGAMIALGFSLLCDGIDGRIARTKKNRTAKEKAFGVQIDSLSDITSFGVLPATIARAAGVKGFFGVLSLVIYVLCVLIRLAYFNVLANAPKANDPNIFHGLPCVCLPMILPFVFMLSIWIPANIWTWFASAVFIIFGALYIIDIKAKKASLVMMLFYGLLFLVPCIIFFIYGGR